MSVRSIAVRLFQTYVFTSFEKGRNAQIWEKLHTNFTMPAEEREPIQELELKMDEALTRTIKRFERRVRKVEEGGFPQGPSLDRRPREEGGHDRVVFSLDQRTRDYLAMIPRNHRSEVVEDAVLLYSLLSDELKVLEPDLKPERIGRRRRIQKQRRL